jgi:hypothetical protein
MIFAAAAKSPRLALKHEKRRARHASPDGHTPAKKVALWSRPYAKDGLWQITMHTRDLIVAATIFDAVLAGTDVDRLLVQMPAWRDVGVAGWAAYSRHADLANGLVLYPTLAIAGCVLSVAAAINVARERADGDRQRFQHTWPS